MAGLNAPRTWAGLRAALALGVLAMVAAALMPGTATADDAGTVTVYPMGGLTLAPGSDGNIWVAQSGQILKVSPSDGQVLDTYPVPGGPGELSPGPDGRIWFQVNDTQVGAMSTNGDVATYDVPSGCYKPTAGPGQTIWLVCGSGAGSLDIATDTVTQFPLPHGTQTNFVLGPDGNMWFGDLNGTTYQVGKITPDTGTVTLYDLHFLCTSGFTGITSGPDGKIWFEGFNDFQHCGGGSVGAITTDGVIGPILGGGGRFPSGITEGPDGNVWFGDSSPYQAIWRLAPDGTATKFPVGTATGNPIAGPDGRVWFLASGKVAAITTGVTPVPVGTIGELGLVAILGAVLWFATRRRRALV